MRLEFPSWLDRQPLRLCVRYRGRDVGRWIVERNHSRAKISTVKGPYQFSVIGQKVWCSLDTWQRVQNKLTRNNGGRAPLDRARPNKQNTRDKTKTIFFSNSPSHTHTACRDAVSPVVLFYAPLVRLTYPDHSHRRRRRRRRHHFRAQNATVSYVSAHTTTATPLRMNPSTHQLITASYTAHPHTYIWYIRQPLHYPYFAYTDVYVYKILRRLPEYNAKLSTCEFLFLPVLSSTRRRWSLKTSLY